MKNEKVKMRIEMTVNEFLNANSFEWSQNFNPTINYG